MGVIAGVAVWVGDSVGVMVGERLGVNVGLAVWDGIGVELGGEVFVTKISASLVEVVLGAAVPLSALPVERFSGAWTGELHAVLRKIITKEMINILPVGDRWFTIVDRSYIRIIKINKITLQPTKQ